MGRNAAGVSVPGARNVGLLSLVALLGNLFFDRAIWIIYLSERGYSLLQIGVLQSVLHLTILLFEIPTGVVADLAGRKVSLLIGRGLASLYLVGMMFAGSFYMTAGLFFLFGLSITFLSGAEEALLFDSAVQSGVPEEKTSRVVGRYYSLMTIALAIAMAAGGFLKGISWQLVYGLSAAFQLGAFAVVLLLREVGAVEKTERQPLLGHIRETAHFIRSSGVTRNLMLGVAIYSAVVSTYYMFAQDLLSGMGVATAGVSILFAVESLLSAGVLAGAHVVEGRFSPKGVLLFSLAISAVVFPLAAFRHRVSGFGVFFVLSLIYSLYQPISSAVVNREIPSEQRATLLSVMSFSSSMVMFLLFPFVGYLADKYEVGQVLGAIGTLAMVVCCGLVVYFFSRRKAAQSLSAGGAPSSAD